MTEEAFIRAVVAAPGQDTPRLVYADWLDDHGDAARAAYLRAETEGAAMNQTCLRPPEADLREAAARLDPLWVARVSRPPLGVCCAHLLQSSEGEPATDAEIDAAAAELGVALPPQLRALLLNYALGTIRGVSLEVPQFGPPHFGRVGAFVCLVDPDWTDGRVSYELVDRTLWSGERYGAAPGFAYLAEIGWDSGTHLAVSCREPDHGVIYFLHWERMEDDPVRGPIRVADSVGAFLALLEPQARPFLDNPQPGG